MCQEALLVRDVQISAVEPFSEEVFLGLFMTPPVHRGYAATFDQQSSHLTEANIPHLFVDDSHLIAGYHGATRARLYFSGSVRDEKVAKLRRPYSVENVLTKRFLPLVVDRCG